MPQREREIDKFCWFPTSNQVPAASLREREREIVIVGSNETNESWSSDKNRIGKNRTDIHIM